MFIAPLGTHDALSYVQREEKGEDMTETGITDWN